MWILHGVKSAVTSITPKLPPHFDSPVRPTSRMKSAKIPLAVFELFVTAAVLQIIVLRTNECSPRLNLQFEELQAFIGMNDAMSML